MEFKLTNEILKSYKSYDDLLNVIIQSKSAECCEFCLDYDGIWKRLTLKWMIDYFIEKEEYEKCIIVNNYILTDYIANDLRQDELNTKLNEITKAL